MTLTVAQMIAMARRLIARSHTACDATTEPLCPTCQQRCDGLCDGADDVQTCRCYEHVRNIQMQPGLDVDSPLLEAMA